MPIMKYVALVCLWCGPVLAAGHRGRRSDVIASGSSRAQVFENIWSSKEYSTPMQRVVALLEQMRSELQTEANQESEMYDRMVCWCNTNEKDKTTAIADADQKTTDLQTEIEERSARHGVLSTEIDAMKKQISADEASLKTATAIREKEAAAFNDEEKEMVQAVVNLKNAIAVLAKHHGGASSMMQMDQIDPPVLASVKAVLRDVSEKYDLLAGDELRSKPASSGAVLLTVTNGQKEGLDKALRREFEIDGTSSSSALPLDIAEHMLANYASGATKDGSAFVQSTGKQPADFKSYNSRSGTIFGILKQMKDEFEANLSQAQKDEMAARAAFEELSKSKAAQIAIAKEKLDNMENDHADNQKGLSDAKEDLDLTRQQRSADVEFLRNLRLNCQAQDHEWETRSATRAEELKAVNEALVILQTDDNRELMAKTVTLLQVKSDSASELQVRRSRAAAALRAASSLPDFDSDDLLAAWHDRHSETPKAQLSTLAVSVELDNFSKVKASLDKMLSDLKAQQAEEVKAKAYCVEEMNSNDKMTYRKTQDKADLEATMDSLAATIKKLNSETKSAQEQIAETKIEIKKAGAARETENKEFQTVVADARATQAILAKVLARLELFYKRGKTALLQRSQKQTPPEKFNKYKKNAGHKSVMGLIEQIVEDSKALESEAMTSEHDAQVAYETFVQNSNAVINELGQTIADNTKSVADATLQSEQAASDHASTVDELESLAAYKADLNSRCNFLLKNFDIRQKARLQEMEAIQSAKAFLSGASAAN